MTQAHAGTLLLITDATVSAFEHMGWRNGDERAAGASALVALADWGLVATSVTADEALAELDAQLESAEASTSRDRAYKATVEALRALGVSDSSAMCDRAHTAHLRRTLHAIAASVH